MWLLKDFKIRIAYKKHIVEKGEIAHFPQCFPKTFISNVIKRVFMEKGLNPKETFACKRIYTEKKTESQRHMKY